MYAYGASTSANRQASAILVSIHQTKPIFGLGRENHKSYANIKFRRNLLINDFISVPKSANRQVVAILVSIHQQAFKCPSTKEKGKK